MGDLVRLNCLKRLWVACALTFAYSGVERMASADDLVLLPVDTAPVDWTRQSNDDPVIAEMNLNRGVMAFEQGKYAEALDSLEHADSLGAGTKYYRGLCLLASRRAREAILELEAVLQRPNAPAEAELDLGVAQLAAGDIVAGDATLEKYVATHPDDPYGHYFWGVALFRQRRDREALAQFERASSEASLAPYSDFYRGLVAYDQGDPQFRQYLDRYEMGADKIGPAAELARRLSPAAGRPIGTDVAPERRWNLSILTGYEFDTNVAQAPSISGLGSTSAEEDSRWVLALFGEYRPIQRDDCVVGLIGSTYSGSQFAHDEFDVQDYMGGAYANVLLGSFILGTRYEFHETLLNEQQFSTDHRVTPNLTYREGDFGHITGFYEFERIDVEGLALVPAQARSGDVHAVGVTQAVYLFEGSGRLFLGYRFERALTDGSDFDRHTNMLTGRVEMPLGCQIVGDAEVRQVWDDYDNPNSLDFFDRARTDRRIEARVGMQKYFTPHLSMRLDYVYTMNDSNVVNLFGSSFYSYDRHIVSTLLIYDF